MIRSYIEAPDARRLASRQHISAHAAQDDVERLPLWNAFELERHAAHRQRDRR